MKLRITIAILILLFSFTSAFGLVDKQEIVNDIIKSIKEQPEHWIDGGHRFSFFEDIKEAKEHRHSLYPELDADVSLSYNINHLTIYVHIEEPFKHAFEGKQLKAIVQELQLFKFKILQEQVGHLLNQRVEVEKKIIPKEKEEQIVENGFKKL